MINVIPFIGWGLSLLISICLSIPFWYLWTHSKLGITYFSFLPSVWTSIPFWHCVALMIVISIIKVVIFPHNIISVSK